MNLAVRERETRPDICFYVESPWQEWVSPGGREKELGGLRYSLGTGTNLSL